MQKICIFSRETNSIIIQLYYFKIYFAETVPLNTLPMMRE